MSQLGLGIIGGRTYGSVSLAAFEALAHRFGTWDRVRDAPVAEVQKTIRAVTYAEAKAAHLQGALRRITAVRGRLTLDFLRALTVENALIWLENLSGVGRKASAATLNFSTLRMEALVIDTHHLRVLRRLGLVNPRTDLAEAHDRITPCLPADWTADDLDDHHGMIKALGQKTCRHGNPDCGGCPLSDLCPTGGAVKKAE